MPIQILDLLCSCDHGSIKDVKTIESGSDNSSVGDSNTAAIREHEHNSSIRDMSTAALAASTTWTQQRQGHKHISNLENVNIILLGAWTRRYLECEWSRVGNRKAGAWDTLTQLSDFSSPCLVTLPDTYCVHISYNTTFPSLQIKCWVVWLYGQASGILEGLWPNQNKRGSKQWSRCSKICAWN